LLLLQCFFSESRIRSPVELGAHCNTLMGREQSSGLEHEQQIPEVIDEAADNALTSSQDILVLVSSPILATGLAALIIAFSI
jgi:uncharacterized protein YpuA (DUF1002 family)